MVSNRTAEIEGLEVFYREAGDPVNPKLLLLGGFPASSHQFRNLIPALADRFHVLSPDYPGFGNTDMPEDFEYTFYRLLADRRRATRRTRVLAVRALPPGLRRPDRQPHRRAPPDWLEWQVIQLERLRRGLHGRVGRHPPRPLARPQPRDRSAARAVPGARRSQARLHPRAPRPGPDQPRQLEHGLHFLERPGARKVQLDLLYDYRTNVDLYPQWQAFLRERKPKTLILWGENDIFFTPEGGRATCATCPRPNCTCSDSGHFAVEDSLDEIVTHIKRFHAEQVVGRMSVRAADPAESIR